MVDLAPASTFQSQNAPAGQVRSPTVTDPHTCGPALANTGQGRRLCCAQTLAISGATCWSKIIREFYLYLAAALTVIRRLINRARTVYRWPTRPTTRLLH